MGTIGSGSGIGKKKQSGNVRRILLSRKGLRDFLEELVCVFRLFFCSLGGVFPPGILPFQA
jgi:hypothetical protein